jgi:hypothetical protein
MLPTYLTHYYERAHGPFRSLSDLPLAEAETALEQIRLRGEVFASRRPADYMPVRFSLEERIGALFAKKGGAPRHTRPLYCILGSCEWCRTWYRDPTEVRLPLDALDPAVVSFTYGDSFPAMRFQDGKAYRGQVYTLTELPALLAQYGLPQAWNPNGLLGPERYIEAQIWDYRFKTVFARHNPLEQSLQHG